MSYVRSNEKDYVQYNNETEVKDLDVNVWRATAGDIADGATGRHMYRSEPRHPAYYTCFGGRDPGTHYIFGVERDSHPDHSSRFGYARCANGYCSGHWPGRYNEADVCSEYDPQPPDMAPERFYTAPYQGPYNDLTQAVVDYELEKNKRMNFLSWWRYSKN